MVPTVRTRSSFEPSRHGCSKVQIIVCAGRTCLTKAQGVFGILGSGNAVHFLTASACSTTSSRMSGKTQSRFAFPHNGSLGLSRFSLFHDGSLSSVRFIGGVRAPLFLGIFTKVGERKREISRSLNSCFDQRNVSCLWGLAVPRCEAGFPGARAEFQLSV